MKKTRKAYEQKLNDQFTECYNTDEAIYNFMYLNNGKIKESTIVAHYHNRTLGTLFRKHDPIGFNAGYNEWGRIKRF